MKDRKVLLESNFLKKNNALVSVISMSEVFLVEVLYRHKPKALARGLRVSELKGMIRESGLRYSFESFIT